MFVLKNMHTGNFFRFTEHGGDVSDVFFADRLNTSDLWNVKHDINSSSRRFLIEAYEPYEVNVKLSMLNMDYNEVIRNEKRRAVLAKLSQEEKQLLGLE